MVAAIIFWEDGNVFRDVLPILETIVKIQTVFVSIYRYYYYFCYSLPDSLDSIQSKHGGGFEFLTTGSSRFDAIEVFIRQRKSESGSGCGGFDISVLLERVREFCGWPWFLLVSVWPYLCVAKLDPSLPSLH